MLLIGREQTDGQTSTICTAFRAMTRLALIDQTFLDAEAYDACDIRHDTCCWVRSSRMQRAGRVLERAPARRLVLGGRRAVPPDRLQHDHSPLCLGVRSSLEMLLESAND